MKPFFLASLLLLAPLLAGCAEEANDSAPVETADAAPPLGGSTDPAASEANATLAASPHLHDYWRGKERVTLLDADYTVDAPTAAFWTLFTTYYAREPCAGGAFVELPEGSLVFEGTGRLEITVTWTDPTVTGMRLVYRHAGSGEMIGWIDTPPGEVVSIPVTADMTDMPHSQHSRWFFVFAADGTPPLAVGTFHVKMEVVKMRDLSLFPPHPDFWNGASHVEVLRAEGAAKSELGPRERARERIEPMRTPDDVVPGEKPVPMETTLLVVNVTIRSVTPELKVERLRLQYHAPDRPGFVFRTADAGRASDDGATWTFEIPVEMAQTDNPYRETSDWWYRVRPTYAGPVPGLPPCDEGCHDAELRYGIVVTATRGSAPPPGE